MIRHVGQQARQEPLPPGAQKRQDSAEPALSNTGSNAPKPTSRRACNPLVAAEGLTVVNDTASGDGSEAATRVLSFS